MVGTPAPGKRRSQPLATTIIVGGLILVGFFTCRPIVVNRLNIEAGELIAHGSGACLHAGHHHESHVEGTDAYHLALKKLEVSRRWDPRNAETWMLTGDAQSRMGNLPEAIRSYQRAVQIDPHGINYHAGLAELYLHQKDYPKARAEFQKALDIKPKDVGCLRFLALICDKTGDTSGAIRYAKRLVLMQKNDPVAARILQPGK